jgi:hypothetical protein
MPNVFELTDEELFVPASDCTFKMTPKNSDEQIYMMFHPWFFMIGNSQETPFQPPSTFSVEPGYSGEIITG